MRPILYDVDAGRNELTLLYYGPPNRLVTLRIRTPGDDAMEAARRQVAAMTEAELEQLRPT